MVALSNGEKIHPLAMEALINGHPAIRACLVVSSNPFIAGSRMAAPFLFPHCQGSHQLCSLTRKQVGTGKFQASLLVGLIDPEPTSRVEREALMESIYERVQVANDSAPAHARLLRE